MAVTRTPPPLPLLVTLPEDGVKLIGCSSFLFKSVGEILGHISWLRTNFLLNLKVHVLERHITWPNKKKVNKQEKRPINNRKEKGGKKGAKYNTREEKQKEN